jgi:hypothetical protein
VLFHPYARLEQGRNRSLRPSVMQSYRHDHAAAGDKGINISDKKGRNLPSRRMSKHYISSVNRLLRLGSRRWLLCPRNPG